ALGPAAERLRPAGLTINYRTPQEAMALAATALADIDPDIEAPAAIRSSGFSPWSLRADAEALGDVAAGVVALEARAVGDGRIAVVTPAALRAGIGEALARGLGERVATTTATALDRPVSLLGAGIGFAELRADRAESVGGARPEERDGHQTHDGDQSDQEGVLHQARSSLVGDTEPSGEVSADGEKIHPVLLLLLDGRTDGA